MISHKINQAAFDSRLKDLIEATKKVSYVKEYQNQATDAEALGVMISKYFHWSGVDVMKTFYSALEDSNFHTEAREVKKMLSHPDYQ